MAEGRSLVSEPSISGNRPFVTPVAIWADAPQRTTGIGADILQRFRCGAGRNRGVVV